MAKKVTALIKLQIPAGKANPAPPIGPALGQKGVNIMEFCKQFNAQTQKLEKGLGFRLEMRDDPLLKPDEFKLVVKGAGRDVTQQYAVA